MYHRDGKKNGEGTYVDKKKDGLWIYYGINGIKILEENYSKGVKTGVWKYYYENGRINKMENYRNDHRNGEYMEFYPDSVLKTKGNYVNDKLNGVVQFYGLIGKCRPHREIRRRYERRRMDVLQRPGSGGKKAYL